MRTECAEIETSVSFYRRLAQARLEILDAERARRSRGGSVSDLVDDLPRILAGDGGRSGPADTRAVPADAPAVELRWQDGKERLVGDETLANMVVLTDDEVVATIAELQAFERELSETRRNLHGVLDRIEHEIATRQAAGTAG